MPGVSASHCQTCITFLEPAGHPSFGLLGWADQWSVQCLAFGSFLPFPQFLEHLALGSNYGDICSHGAWPLPVPGPGIAV
jgi:hypothetical protein